MCRGEPSTQEEGLWGYHSALDADRAVETEGATTENDPSSTSEALPADEVLPADEQLPEPGHVPPLTPAAPPVAARDSARGFWAAVVVTLAVLTLLVVFIAENTQDVHVRYLGGSWHPPLGVALLVAAIVGGLVVVLAVAARVLQLRRRARVREAEHERSAGGVPTSPTRRTRRRRG